VKADSGAHAIIKESKTFALNILGKEKRPGVHIFQNRSSAKGIRSRRAVRKGTLGADLEKGRPLLNARSSTRLEKGDHSSLSVK